MSRRLASAERGRALRRTKLRGSAVCGDRRGCPEGAAGNSTAPRSSAAATMPANRSNRAESSRFDEQGVGREAAFAIVEQRVARNSVGDFRRERSRFGASRAPNVALVR